MAVFWVLALLSLVDTDRRFTRNPDDAGSKFSEISEHIYEAQCTTIKKTAVFIPGNFRALKSHVVIRHPQETQVRT
jgi:hypothetical protein